MPKTGRSGEPASEIRRRILARDWGQVTRTQEHNWQKSIDRMTEVEDVPPRSLPIEEHDQTRNPRPRRKKPVQ